MRGKRLNAYTNSLSFFKVALSFSPMTNDAICVAVGEALQNDIERDFIALLKIEPVFAKKENLYSVAMAAASPLR